MKGCGIILSRCAIALFCPGVVPGGQYYVKRGLSRNVHLGMHYPLTTNCNICIIYYIIYKLCIYVCVKVGLISIFYNIYEKDEDRVGRVLSYTDKSLLCQIYCRYSTTYVQDFDLTNGIEI